MEYWRDLRQDKQEVVDVRKEETQREGWVGHAITRIGEVLAHPLFFLAALLLHAAWVLLNIPTMSPIRPFDPPPFTLLATIASVEAPLLALLILMRQQQDRRVAELQEDTSLQATLHVEREASKLLRMMDQLHQALGIERGEDPELEAMKKPMDPESLVESLRQRMEERADEPGHD